MEDNHKIEVKNIKDRISATEQEKREKWTQQKTKLIKVSNLLERLF